MKPLTKQEKIWIEKDTKLFNKLILGFYFISFLLFVGCLLK